MKITFSGVVFVFAILSSFYSIATVFAEEDRQLLRVGIIGCDTGHAPAFTKVFHSPENDEALEGIKVVAAFPGGSPDLANNREHLEKFSGELREMGMEIVDSIDELLTRVDVVLLESVDGRKHLEQVRPVFASGKPVFIDKPIAGSLADAVEIVELARKHKVPCFSSSSLRYTPEIHGARSNSQIGEVIGCTAYSPCTLDRSHPDLYWYGIHGVETLFTIMGPGCVSVVRIQADDAEVVTGVWEDGRLASYRGQRSGKQDFGAIVFGSKSIHHINGFAGYQPLVKEIGKFFKTHDAPVSLEETLEIFAFMEAADESKRLGGVPVTLESVLAKARAEVAARQ